MDQLPQTNDMSVMMQGMKAMILQIVGDTCQQIQAKSNNAQATASPEPAPALIPNNPHIDMRLAGPEDMEKLQHLGAQGILTRLHNVGGPWADIVDVQFDLDSGHHQQSDEPNSPDAVASRTHEAQRRVRFVLETVAGEQAVRKVMHEASLILGLSPNCGMIQQLYYVRVVGFVRQATEPAPNARTGQSPKAASGNSSRNAKKRSREGEFSEDEYTEKAAFEQVPVQVPQSSGLTWVEPNTPATMHF
ncbi:hypothetical protein CEP52_014806 [Fusarium oligoseptatum]|uniref:Uncharacterized protein n=1 Tax=Fusarium oligoseptatum TaxID=2604345 RepID=A0A428SIU4_9HYPO|nr:hypothetical protein CEP52_014806 [Fusarium oligoseptatum]